jgi:hypothetical protein
MTIAVLNAVVTASGVEPGGGGGTTFTVTVDVFETPPGPVARYVNVSFPTKPVLGVYVMVFDPVALALPFVGGVTTETLVKTPVIALVRSIAVEPPAFTAALKFAVTGGGGFTVTVTVAGVDVPPAPVAVYWNVSVPKNPAFGVYVIVLVLVAIATPFAAGEETATLVKAPVIADVRLIGIAVWKGVVTLTGEVRGAAVTVIVTVAGVEVPPGPVAVYWNVSTPLKLVFGV